MPGKMIECIIEEDGSVKIEVHNAHGAECEALTEEIEKALGKTTDRKRKREFYEKEQSKHQESRM